MVSYPSFFSMPQYVQLAQEAVAACKEKRKRNTGIAISPCKRGCFEWQNSLFSFVKRWVLTRKNMAVIIC